MEIKLPLIQEETRSILQPDTLLAYEYLQQLRRTSHLEPEKRLMLAILEDAVNCFQKFYMARNRKKRECFHDAEAWILAEESDWLFSFDNICETLELEPNYLRQGLLSWKEAKLRGNAAAKNCRPGPRKKVEDDHIEAGRSFAA